MSQRVLPTVRLLFACDDASYDGTSERWVLINPWSVVSLPAHASFPFRAHAVCVYAQLSGGLGRFELALEMRQQRDDGSTRAVGSSKVQQFDFNEANRLLAAEISFRLQQVPFREAGLYELRILASDGANNWLALPACAPGRNV